MMISRSLKVFQGFYLYNAQSVANINHSDENIFHDGKRARFVGFSPEGRCPFPCGLRASGHLCDG
jgi:hypothetical protein